MTSTTITIIGSLGGLLLAFYGLIRWQIGQLDVRLGRFEGEVNNKFAEAKEDTKAGFAKVDVQFDKVDARFDKAEERVKEQLAEAKKDNNDRFDKMDAQFAEMKQDTNARFDKMDAQFAEMKQDNNDRFDKVDAQFAEMKQDNNDRFDKVDARFDKAEERVKVQFAEAKKDTNDRFNKVEAEVGQICVRLTSIDERLTEADASRREMNKKLDVIPSLEAGIQDLLRSHTRMNRQLADLEIKFSRLEPLFPQNS